MDNENSQQGEKTYYRWVAPAKWSAELDQPMSTAFYLRENEKGISVFDSSIATPDDVLEDLLNIWRKNDRQKELKKYGNSASGMRQAGYHVIEVKESDFTRMGFEPDVGNVDKRGHLEILGSQEEFELYAPDLVDASKQV